jgi:hypothetical protein
MRASNFVPYPALHSPEKARHDKTANLVLSRHNVTAAIQTKEEETDA